MSKKKKKHRPQPAPVKTKRDRWKDSRASSCPTLLKRIIRLPPDVRHAQRKAVALRCEGVIRGWCERRGIKMSIHNQGHHWLFKFEKRQADWYPASAKLIVDQRFQEGIHVHCCDQIRYELGQSFLAKRNKKQVVC